MTEQADGEAEQRAGVLIVNNIDCRQDWILFAYGGAVSVALWDMGVAFLKDITLKKEIGGTVV